MRELMEREADHKARERIERERDEEREVGRHGAFSWLEYGEGSAARAMPGGGSLELDFDGPSRPWPPGTIRACGVSAVVQVMLHGHRQREQEFALSVEQMDLRFGRHQFAHGVAEQLPRLSEQARGAEAAVLAQLVGLPKAMRSTPSSRRALRTVLPLSTRGSEISRLYAPTVMNSSPCL